MSAETMDLAITDELAGNERSQARLRIDYNRLACIAFFHVSAIVGFFFFPLTSRAVVAALVLYFVCGFGLTAGHHRYFSHRSYKTSRAFQLLLAVMGMMQGQQNGVLWWSANHRHHHRFADREEDSHSPVQRGLFYSQFLWVFDKRNTFTRYNLIRDFESYPELRWLNEHYLVPFLGWTALVYLYGGAPAVYWGSIVMSVIIFHLATVVNSIGHRFGSRRYPTTDGSRNIAWLAILTIGDGWHNNHHYYMKSARHGFFWWELDVTYMTLKALSALGVVWDLHLPPPQVIAAGRAASSP